MHLKQSPNIGNRSKRRANNDVIFIFSIKDTLLSFRPSTNIRSFHSPLFRAVSLLTISPPRLPSPTPPCPPGPTLRSRRLLLYIQIVLLPNRLVSHDGLPVLASLSGSHRTSTSSNSLSRIVWTFPLSAIEFGISTTNDDSPLISLGPR